MHTSKLPIDKSIYLMASSVHGELVLGLPLVLKTAFHKNVTSAANNLIFRQ